MAMLDELRNRAPAFADKIAPLYAALGWKWHDSPEPPTAARILKSINQLIDHMADHDDTGTVSGGGLSVWLHNEGYGTECGIGFEFSENVYESDVERREGAPPA